MTNSGIYVLAAFVGLIVLVWYLLKFSNLCNDIAAIRKLLEAQNKASNITTDDLPTGN